MGEYTDHLLRAIAFPCPGKAQCIRSRGEGMLDAQIHTPWVISVSEADSYPLERQRKQQKLG